MPQDTTIPVTAAHVAAEAMGAIVAQAICHLADAIDRIDPKSAVRWRMEAVRDLAEQLSDPTPAPSCDAPHCDCETGEDCKANVAAEEEPDPRFYDAEGKLKETDQVANADFVEFLRHVRDAAIARKKADPKHAPREFVVTVDGNDLHVQESGPDWHLRTALAHRELLADTAAAIAIQGKRLDMLLKRLPDPDTHTVRVVMPNEVNREGDVETWILDPAFQGHDAQFAMGDALTDSSASHGIFQVLSVGQRFVDKKISLRVKRHPGFVFDTEAF